MVEVIGVEVGSRRMQEVVSSMKVKNFEVYSLKVGEQVHKNV